ncbi:quinone-dependent dihydroorotate dehydrogenase [Hoeflea sp. WL0058]|uniref:Dihydroorotate dehydrogenase (quinone) n=1 Tax=Flavimaribacter sediminis TaxID=2865987 RepID=A0AAE2ZN37_9HYPH|nr:quinone-dependent dihydroorotate dehydrogenase [Flavimaribacter sediminis]MBW8637725.1 quinone-dependent dihydroorotate dehydrogenase [Flavimaribacter sediminis]
MDHLYQAIGRKLLFTLDPETAHGLSVRALQRGLVPRSKTRRAASLVVRTAGLVFANPVGMAAGFDKNAEVPDAILDLGFGFTEVGTVTPLAQDGNPKPRIFRLANDEAIINRMGFNNNGHEAALARLKGRARRRDGPVGVNVGANKDSADRIADYRLGVETFYDVADYFTVNISSPNTPGLRDLQSRQNLALLLRSVSDARAARTDAGADYRPIFLKIAPDLVESDLDDIAAETTTSSIDGVIVSNTTLSRKGLSDVSQASESGGLSGPPLFERSTIVLAKMRQRLGQSFTLIGVGGVDSAESAATKIWAGANLVQLYTGFVYQGPVLAQRITDGLHQIVKRSGRASIHDLVGADTQEWASRPIPD